MASDATNEQSDTTVWTKGEKVKRSFINMCIPAIKLLLYENIILCMYLHTPMHTFTQKLYRTGLTIKHIWPCLYFERWMFTLFLPSVIMLCPLVAEFKQVHTFSKYRTHQHPHWQARNIQYSCALRVGWTYCREYEKEFSNIINHTHQITQPSFSLQGKACNRHTLQLKKGLKLSV